jgi:hypothetical protein
MTLYNKHDIWNVVFDFVNDNVTLKTSNLVCAEWHACIQPRLLSCKYLRPGGMDHDLDALQ